jgi:hypothetical protein
LIDQRNRFQRFWLYVINTLNITGNKARPTNPLWLLGIMAGLLSVVDIRKLRKA